MRSHQTTRVNTTLKPLYYNETNLTYKRYRKTAATCFYAADKRATGIQEKCIRKNLNNASVSYYFASSDLPVAKVININRYLFKKITSSRAKKAFLTTFDIIQIISVSIAVIIKNYCN